MDGTDSRVRMISALWSVAWLAMWPPYEDAGRTNRADAPCHRADGGRDEDENDERADHRHGQAGGPRPGGPRTVRIEGVRALARRGPEEHCVQMTLQAVPDPESPAGRWTW